MSAWGLYLRDATQGQCEQILVVSLLQRGQFDCYPVSLSAKVELTRRIAGRPPLTATKDTDGSPAIRSDRRVGESMKSRMTRILARLAVLALIAGLQPGVANAAKSGTYFEEGPDCCQAGVDLSGERVREVSTADAAVTNGILKVTTTTKRAIYTSGQYWISYGQFGSGGMLWSVGNVEAFRRDFAFWPTNRVKVWFYPDGSERTGYLAAYNTRGRLLVQKTFTSNQTTVLDTGTTKGRIAYVLASFDGPGGLLGKVGYYVSVH